MSSLAAVYAYVHHNVSSRDSVFLDYVRKRLWYDVDGRPAAEPSAVPGWHSVLDQTDQQDDEQHRCMVLKHGHVTFAVTAVDCAEKHGTVCFIEKKHSGE